MNVALLIETFGGLGGAERQTGLLASGLRDRGHKVKVFAARLRGSIPGVEAVALGAGSHASFARAAARAVPPGAFDIVHSYARTTSQDILRLGGGVHAEYLRRMEPFRTPLERWFSRWNPKEKRILALEKASFAPGASRLLQAVSRRVKDEAVAHYGVDPARIAVLHNAVDTRHFSPKFRERRAGILSSLGLPERTFLILFAGTGFRRKGLDAAIEAVARVPAAHHPCLAVVGAGRTGPYEKLARRTGAQVRFVGPRPDIDNFYGAAGALLFPTRYDPFPNVCLEAMACGVPVVVTRVAGVAEIIEDGVQSFIVDEPDPAVLAERLVRLADPSFRAEMGARARELAERHPIGKYVDDTVALYERVLREKSGGPVPAERNPA